MLKAIGIVAFVLVAAAGGGAAGLFLSPGGGAAHDAPEELEAPATLAFDNDLIVPLVSEGQVVGHIVVSLALESHTLTREAMREREVVYRDRLLEALLRHGAIGGFTDAFTDTLAMNRLRLALNEALRPALPPGADATALITSINRRDR